MARPQEGLSPAELDRQNVFREKFQDAVAGTFYRTMLKALRSTEQKPAYMHGGTAEDIFKSQLDEQFADTFSKSNGAAFSDSLFAVMQERWNSQTRPGFSAEDSSNSGTAEQSASDAAKGLLEALNDDSAHASLTLPANPQLGARAYSTAYSTTSMQEPAHVLNLVG